MKLIVILCTIAICAAATDRIFTMYVTIGMAAIVAWTQDRK
jgi:hypothetical protein